VIGPVTVAVHLNVNPTLIVIHPVDPLRCPLVDGSDHLHGVDHDHELRPTCDEWSDLMVDPADMPPAVSLSRSPAARDLVP